MIPWLDCVMPMNGRFIELMKVTIQFRLRGMVLKISAFKVTSPEVFNNSAFCMMLVPSIVCSSIIPRSGNSACQAVSRILRKSTYANEFEPDGYHTRGRSILILFLGVSGDNCMWCIRALMTLRVNHEHQTSKWSCHSFCQMIRKRIIQWMRSDKLQNFIEAQKVLKNVNRIYQHTIALLVH